MFSKIVSSVSSALDFNLATLSGCIDIIVVPSEEDGQLHSTPFHVRFGKAKLLRSREKVVSVTVNWQPTDLKMTLGSAGEAYFIVEDTGGADGENRTPDEYDQYFLQHEGDEASPIVEIAKGRSHELISEASSVDHTAPNLCPTTTNGAAIGEDQDGTSGAPHVSFSPMTKLADSSAIGDDNILNFTTEETDLPKETAPSPLAPGMLATPSPVALSSGFRGAQIEVSLCGHLLLGRRADAQHDNDVFMANLIDWGKISASPDLWYDPATVFRFNGEPPYFPAKTALPLIASWVIFGQSLTAEAFQRLLLGQLRFKDPANPVVNIQLKAHSLLHPPQAPDFSPSTAPDSHYWGSDERPASARKSSRIAMPRARSMSPHHRASGLLGCGTESSGRAYQRLCAKWNMCGPPAEEDELATQFGRVDSVSAAEVVTATQLQQMTGIHIVKAAPPGSGVEKRDEGASQTSVLSPVLSPALLAIEEDTQTLKRRVKRYRKSLKPTSAQLESLGLKPGPNPITFSVTSALQGTKTVTGTIYLWPRNAKIVVSDVDGTITRSDVWGQLMPIVGRDWSHPGVAELFSNIRQSDFKMLYLTARAIGQADSTRDYLFGLTQNERNKLPDGPLILSPDRLFPSFKREVIDRKPYVFKIAALRDIRSLFPSFYNPFYAGFGNRDTDHRAYVHVGVPEARIFIVDPTGQVHHVNRTYAKTYESMSQMVADMFPPVNVYDSSRHIAVDEFNSFNYWRLPLTLPNRGTRRFPPLGGELTSLDPDSTAIERGSLKRGGPADEMDGTVPTTSTIVAAEQSARSEGTASAFGGRSLVPVLTNLRLSRWSAGRTDNLGDEEELLTAREFGPDFGVAECVASSALNLLDFATASGSGAIAHSLLDDAAGGRRKIRGDFESSISRSERQALDLIISEIRASRRRSRSNDQWNKRRRASGAGDILDHQQQNTQPRSRFGYAALSDGTSGVASPDEMMLFLAAAGTTADPVVATAIAFGTNEPRTTTPFNGQGSPLPVGWRDSSMPSGSPAAHAWDGMHRQTQPHSPSKRTSELEDMTGSEDRVERRSRRSSSATAGGSDFGGFLKRRRVQSCRILTARERAIEFLVQQSRLLQSQYTNGSFYRVREGLGASTSGAALISRSSGDSFMNDPSRRTVLRDDEFVEAMSGTSNLMSWGRRDNQMSSSSSQKSSDSSRMKLGAVESRDDGALLRSSHMAEAKIISGRSSEMEGEDEIDCQRRLRHRIRRRWHAEAVPRNRDERRTTKYRGGRSFGTLTPQRTAVTFGAFAPSSFGQLAPRAQSGEELTQYTRARSDEEGIFAASRECLSLVGSEISPERALEDSETAVIILGSHEREEYWRRSAGSDPTSGPADAAGCQDEASSSTDKKEMVPANGRPANRSIKSPRKRLEQSTAPENVLCRSRPTRRRRRRRVRRRLITATGITPPVFDLGCRDKGACFEGSPRHRPIPGDALQPRSVMDSTTKQLTPAASPYSSAATGALGSILASASAVGASWFGDRSRRANQQFKPLVPGEVSGLAASPSSWLTMGGRRWQTDQATTRSNSLIETAPGRPQDPVPSPPGPSPSVPVSTSLEAKPEGLLGGPSTATPVVMPEPWAQQQVPATEVRQPLNDQAIPSLVLSAPPLSAPGDQKKKALDDSESLLPSSSSIENEPDLCAQGRVSDRAQRKLRHLSTDGRETKGGDARSASAGF